MRLFTQIVLSFIFFSAEGVSTITPLEEIQEGSQNNLDAFSSSVQITNSAGRQFCSGVLVGPQSVLTAAHCLYHEKTESERTKAQLLVVPGQRARSTSPKDVSYGVKRIIKHPKFNKEKTQNDVAILQLAAPFQSDDLPTSIIKMAEGPPKDGTCLICGWIFNEQKKPGDFFKCATVRLISRENCGESYPGKIVDGMLCALSERGGACKGDSGGPLLCDGVLAGLISTGKDCGNSEYPGVFTDIAEYRAWLTENII